MNNRIIRVVTDLYRYKGQRLYKKTMYIHMYVHRTENYRNICQVH